ncbi:MAG: helix-turn-helix transcriptional regulator [Pseudomonadota bacterium]|nr:helix-turn-helix transcriptional regulator [Pseudomonadota bacterium]
MTYGEFIKAKRAERRLTLRRFCELNNFHPGNISKLERSLMPPPQSEEKLAEYAKALGIKKGSDEYIQLFDLASAGNRLFTVKNISNADVLEKLPAFFRTLDKKGLTSDKLERIIELVKNDIG